MRLKTIIVDDEPLALARLKRLVADNVDIEVIGEANNGQQAVELCAQLEPDLLIMDVRMPVMSGLQAANMIVKQAQPPAVIFCTAFDQYAVAAFETQAVGYVVKPVDAEKLALAVSQATRVNRAQLGALSAAGGKTSTIVLRGIGSLETLAADEIEYFQAEDKRVMAYMPEREVLVDYTLVELEDMLQDEFIRIHRSSLVNCGAIVKVFRNDEGQTLLETRSGVQLPVSRRLVGSVKRQLKNRS